MKVHMENYSSSRFFVKLVLVKFTKNCNYSSLDVNECTLNLDNCHAQAACTNIAGSYSCSCNTGWTGNGFDCEGTSSNEMI